MFKLGETYYTKMGYEARIVSVDAGYVVAGGVCDILALIKVPATVTASQRQAYFFSADGRYLKSGAVAYDLIPNEPNEDEAKLIDEILSFDCEKRDASQKLLGIIRKLKAK